MNKRWMLYGSFPRLYFPNLCLGHFLFHTWVFEAITARLQWHVAVDTSKLWLMVCFQLKMRVASSYWTERISNVNTAVLAQCTQWFLETSNKFLSLHSITQTPSIWQVYINNIFFLKRIGKGLFKWTFFLFSKRNVDLLCVCVIAIGKDFSFQL